MYWEEAAKVFGINWINVTDLADVVIDDFDEDDDAELEGIIGFMLNRYERFQPVDWSYSSSPVGVPDASDAESDLRNLQQLYHSSLGIWNHSFRGMVTAIAYNKITRSDKYLNSDTWDEGLKKGDIKNIDALGQTLIEDITPDIINILLRPQESDDRLLVLGLRDKIGAVIETFLRQESFHEYDITLLNLCVDIWGFYNLCCSDERTLGYAKYNAVSEVLFQLIEKNSDNSLSEKTMLRMRKNSLNLYNPYKCARAFSELIRLANKQDEFQLAYDAGYTYLYGKKVGEIGQLFVLPSKKHIEKITRNNKITYWTIARGFSETCRCIAYYYEPGTYLFKAFINESKKVFLSSEVVEGKKVLYEDCLRIALGDVLRGNINKAIAGFENTIQIAGELVTIAHDSFKRWQLWTYYLRRVCIYKLALLFCKERGDYQKWANNTEVQELVWRIYECCTNIKPDQMIVSADGYVTFCGVLIPSLDAINRSTKANSITVKKGNILLLTEGISDLLTQCLRRYQYTARTFFTRDDQIDAKRDKYKAETNPEEAIAYYTTLKNATFLFDELIEEGGVIREAKKGERGYNCLTFMNGRYMNDPYEGRELIAAMKAKAIFYNDKKEYYREKLLADKHLFLKSFTNRVDELFMWNRYASDYDSAGRNSNGCCVVLDGETFEGIMHVHSKDEMLPDKDELIDRRNTQSENDYSLYRVIYVTDEGKIVSEEKQKKKKMYEVLFQHLQACFSMLDDLVKNDSAKIQNNSADDVIERIMKTSFRDLLFLVKNQSYADEHESRMVVWRSLHAESIRMLGSEHSSTPPKLAISPFFQVFVKQIIFGPNTKSREEWRPYLQSKLDVMWKKYPERLQDRGWSIDNSKIPYSTT